jgi:hypothetical protein
MLLLEMFPHVDAIASYIGDASGHVSASSWTIWPSYSCIFQVLTGSHVVSTCHVFIGTRVMLLLEHVSLPHWTMYRIFIGPRGVTTISHVPFFTRPRVTMLYICVSVFSGPRVMP